MMRIKSSGFLLPCFTFLWVLILSESAFAEAAQPTPMPKTSVHDFAGVISVEKEAEIQAQAQQLKDAYQTEIAVVTIDSLEGEDSFDYSMRMARSWGIGSKDNDIRGLLILIAVKDRKTAFRTSRHIEGEITDGVTGEISRRMNTYFKQGDFGGGLSAGMGMILEKLKTSYEPRPAATRPPKSDSGLGWLWLPVIVLPVGLGYVIVQRRRKKRSEAAGSGQAAASGFRKWASSVDPSTVPESKRKKRSTYVKPAPRRSTKKSRPPAPGIRKSRDDDSWSSSSSYDSGSSSSDDSGSSYSGGSDFGGGGSDSSW